MTTPTSELLDIDELTFTIATHEGRKVWIASDGTILPYISGGDGSDDGSGDDNNDDDGGDDGSDGDDDGSDGDDGDGSGDGDGDGDGSDEDGDTDWKAEAEKWKKTSRKHEGRAKANNKELQRLRREGMSPEHQALEDAKDEGRTEALVQFGERLVEAEIRAQSGQRISDDARDSLIDSIALDKFLTDDGEVDTDKVKDLIDGLAAPGTGNNGNGKGRKLDSGQGRRQGGSARNERKPASVASGRDLHTEMHGKTKK